MTDIEFKVNDRTWLSQRSFPVFKLNISQLKRCLFAADISEEVSAIALICAGLANTNYLVHFESGARVVLRLHATGRSSGLKEYNLSKKLSEFSRIPTVIFYGQDKKDDFYFSFIEYVDGVALSTFVAKNEVGQNLCFELGLFLSSLRSVVFKSRGLLNEDLNIKEIRTNIKKYHPYVNFILDCLENKNFKNRVDAVVVKKVRNIVVRYDELIRVGDDGENHLVHGDFKFENILVDKYSKKLVAVIDWEHARVDSVLGDIATLFRGDYINSIERNEFVKGCEKGNLFLPEEWFRIVKIIDLLNLCSFLCADTERENFYSEIKRLIVSNMEFLDG